MRKIPESNYGKYTEWARSNPSNRVYPLSITEGFQTGEIYASGDACPDTVFFWHYCGFGYLTGKATNEVLGEIHDWMVSERMHRRLVLITNDDEIIRYFRGKNVFMDGRLEYAYQPAEFHRVTYDASRFRIERIDKDNISSIRGRIIPTFSWESNEQFLKNGFGYVAVAGEEICGVAFSSAISPDEVDIGVETSPAYRYNGLAAALAQRMCSEILRMGKKPVWAHAASNIGSMKTALKCGFVEDRRNVFIRKPDK